MVRCTLLGAATIAASFSVGVAGQQATASMAGIVVSADAAAQPIRRATVMLTGLALTTNVSAITDDRGRFTFTNLNAGRYTLTVSKAAYLTQSFGARRPGVTGTMVSIAIGQRITDLRIPLTRGAVLSGLVRDPAGAPLVNMPMAVVRAEQMTTALPYEPPDRLQTDDRGIYRAYGLAPGDYIIAAVPRIPGIGELARRSSTATDSLLRTLKQGGTAALGSSESQATAQVGAAPVFYPGTPLPHEAVKIKVAAGEVRESLDFVVDFVPAITVEGVVTMGDGSPVSGVSVGVEPVGMRPSSSLAFSARYGPGSSFTISNVTPGRYVLLARTMSGQRSSAGGRGQAPVASGGAPPVPLWAMTELDVTGATLPPVTLTLRPALSLSGRIAFDASAIKPPSDVTATHVRLVRLGATGAPAAVVNGVVAGVPVPVQATVQADGSFSIDSIFPGRFAMHGTVPGDGRWWLKSAMAEGRELLDSPVEFLPDSNNLSGVLLTFSDRSSELSGTLQTAERKPASDYFIIVFSTDRAHWHRSSRRIQLTRPASDGQFNVVNLPPGNYLIAALSDVEEDEWQDAAFLEQLVPASIKVTIADGAKVRKDLRIGK